MTSTHTHTNMSTPTSSLYHGVCQVFREVGKATKELVSAYVDLFTKLGVIIRKDGFTVGGLVDQFRTISKEHPMGTPIYVSRQYWESVSKILLQDFRNNEVEGTILKFLVHMTVATDFFIPDVKKLENEICDRGAPQVAKTLANLEGEENIKVAFSNAFDTRSSESGSNSVGSASESSNSDSGSLAFGTRSSDSDSSFMESGSGSPDSDSGRDSGREDQEKPEDKKEQLRKKKAELEASYREAVKQKNIQGHEIFNLIVAPTGKDVEYNHFTGCVGAERPENSWVVMTSIDEEWSYSRSSKHGLDISKYTHISGRDV